MTNIATISKDFEFSSSHQLDGLPETHPCSRLHGHNYTIRVILEGDVTPPGFVIDYRRLGVFKTYLDGELDHRHLNDIMPGNPTAENMAALFVDKVRGLFSSDELSRIISISVAVSETPKTWATVKVIL